MMWLQCNQVHPQGCDWKAMGNSKEEVSDMMAKHMMEMHKDMSDQMGSMDDMKAKMMPMVKEG